MLSALGLWSALSTPGALVLAGGGETTPAMVEAFFSEIGGEEQPIVVLAQTRESPAETGPGSVQLLRENGARDVTLVDGTQFSLSQKRRVAAQILRARGVWIPGGDQNLLIDRFGLKWLQSLFQQALSRGISFFGTSAGAMVMSDPMIAGNSEVPGVPEVRPGIGLVPFLVDTHFRERSREPRLRWLYDNLGRMQAALGLDAGEWVVVRNGAIVRRHGQPFWVASSSSSSRDSVRLQASIR